ncbi:hypothetical protein MKJ01_08310 [Chryseobacterium sp. SSA4.19]|uniref:hypothetical protein n=1 Tax=Chryseobacterium sp. SSA4.19 TaxID=2919915 RepID=UPI001F4E49EC|nr:hypothetical protein [Chryseobacterium sp. SSA4.19]MCJ8153754.1 hypothetical protein [Chryseobacterium sp. SSA4.19]
MKKLFPIFITLILLMANSCKHPVKEEEIDLQNVTAVEDTDPDKIVKDIYTDEFGDQLEVAVNETQNTITIHLNGKSYALKKNDELPEYTAGDADYQYSDINGDITFLRKGYNMVLFHHKKNKSSVGTKMASY